MIADSISFRGHRCFKTEWAGFDLAKPINVIIGRNNSGKSHLLDLVAAFCENSLTGKKWWYRCRGILDEASLKRVFGETTTGGNLQGNHWQSHGRHFVNAEIEWELDENLNPSPPLFLNGLDPRSPFGERSTETRIALIQELTKNVQHKLSGTGFRRLLADRDVRAEGPTNQLDLSGDGRGATNIIRRYTVTSNPQFPRELIQRDLLNALNEVFGSDGHFSSCNRKKTEIKIHIRIRRTREQPSPSVIEAVISIP
jgi:putative ATP-dependent endonuclease of the OLD family